MISNFFKGVSKVSQLSYQLQRGIVMDPTLNNDPTFIPEKALFSHVIQKQIPITELYKYNPKVQEKDTEDYDGEYKDIAKRSINFELTRSDYHKSFESTPSGNINQLEIAGKNVNLVGTIYHQMPLKNIYKILLRSNPSTILLQMRPDQILKSIDLYPRNPKTDKFSNRMYFDQLIHPAASMFPNSRLKKMVKKELLRERILVNESNSEPIKAKFKPYLHYERLHDKAIATACYYAESKGINVVLADLPDIVQRQLWIDNFTVYQLKTMFTKCSRDIALYPDLQPITPYIIGCYNYPEVFLRDSDKYMSCLIEYMVHRGHTNIMALVGNNQSNAVNTYLQKRASVGFESELAVKPKLKFDFNNLDSNLEKMAILDVMMTGRHVFDLLQYDEFKTTSNLFRAYKIPEHEDYIQKHRDFVIQYATMFEKEFLDGKKLLKREFTYKAMGLENIDLES